MATFGMRLLRCVGWVLKFVLGLVLLALARLLDVLTNTGRRRVLFVAALALAATVHVAGRGCGRRTPVRVATFNIRQFGVEATDVPRLVELVRGLEADVVAVQEIQRPARLRELAARVSHGNRRYAAALAACGGRREMYVGFLYDTARVRLVATREFPELDPDGDGRCGDGDRAGLLGTFDDGRRRLHLLVVHLSAGGEAERVARRREQWEQAHRIVAQLRREGADAVAILGDVNSTGYLDDAGGERRFIDDRARAAGMEVATRQLACSEYWRPRRDELAPSLLDHVVATPGVARAGSVRVHGYCVPLRCEPTSSAGAPHDYTHVSDHCPVTFDVAW
jgi:endonuclease/exonuclease/phosphatase family metal-dependent hydrolase